MLVHGRANPLLVRRDEEMQIIRLVKRHIQPHALLGICAGGDSKCCRPISFVILLSLLLDAKSPARTASDIFDSNVGFAIRKGDA